jgi:pro-apoptotic serine protease NMA111
MERCVRGAFPGQLGMLVAETILEEGPACEQIKEGDILLRINNHLLLTFVSLDEILDSSVGQNIKVMIQRRGENIEVDLKIGNLEAITPNHFVTVGGAAFHDLSYQQAMRCAVPVRGVYVCKSSTVGWNRGEMVLSVDRKETPNLNVFSEVMEGIRGKISNLVFTKGLN